MNDVRAPRNSSMLLERCCEIFIPYLARAEHTDSVGDGVGDNADTFTNDPTKQLPDE